MIYECRFLISNLNKTIVELFCNHVIYVLLQLYLLGIVWYVGFEDETSW
jgi:hypothetical protein